MRSLKKKILAPFRELYFRSEFTDSRWGVLFNPFYFARKSLYQNIQKFGKKITGRVLDIGAGTQPYKQVISASEYVSLEYDTPENRANKKADFFYKGTTFPFPSDSFDAILCTQVLEHVFTPEEFLAEMARVLRGNGKILLTVPFVWDEHEQPYDFARYSSFGLKDLLQRHGFSILEQRKTCCDVSCFFQMWNAYLQKKLIGKKSSTLRVIILLALVSVSNLAGILFSRILPENDDFYLDNIVLARKTDQGGW